MAKNKRQVKHEAQEASKAKQSVRLYVKTIKTLYGVKHAVVDANGVIQNWQNGVAVFEYNKAGLANARAAKTTLQTA